MKLLIRVDASIQIGTGHAMRCLALAQAWQNAGDNAIFAMATKVPGLEARLRSEGIEYVYFPVPLGSAEDAKNTASLVQQVGSSWVIADGYHFKTEYQKIIKDYNLCLIVVDDYGHADDYYADFILNQNIYAREELYHARKPYTQLLLGMDYALLRREFWQWRGWKHSHPTVASKLLITLGGSDPDNVTFKVIQALQQVDVKGLEAVVVVGGSNPYYEQLQLASQESSCPICVKRNVTNMPELMAWADVAISAGGSTSWELAFMGVPSLIMIIADNQRLSVETLSKMGVFINLGWHQDVSVIKIADALSKLLVDTKNRVQMTQIGQKVIDGQGASRVLNKILD
jgi:UDP-2,4-diacetamido-2,4,6-trideoxy-beta-L-altropyranose hydrolase